MDERMFSGETMSLPKVTQITSVPRDSSFQYVVELQKYPVPSKLLVLWEEILPELLEIIPGSLDISWKLTFPSL
jgi:hypothetical protein